MGNVGESSRVDLVETWGYPESYSLFLLVDLLDFVSWKWFSVKGPGNSFLRQQFFKVGGKIKF